MQTKAIENLVNAVNVAENIKQNKSLGFLYSLLTSNTFLKIQNIALYFNNILLGVKFVFSKHWTKPPNKLIDKWLLKIRVLLVSVSILDRDTDKNIIFSSALKSGFHILTTAHILAKNQILLYYNIVPNMLKLAVCR